MKQINMKTVILFVIIFIIGYSNGILLNKKLGTILQKESKQQSRLVDDGHGHSILGKALEEEDTLDKKEKKANPIDSIFGLKLLKSMSTDKDEIEAKGQRDQEEQKEKLNKEKQEKQDKEQKDRKEKEAKDQKEKLDKEAKEKKEKDDKEKQQKEEKEKAEAQLKDEQAQKDKKEKEEKEEKERQEAKAKEDKVEKERKDKEELEEKKKEDENMELEKERKKPQDEPKPVPSVVPQADKSRTDGKVGKSTEKQPQSTKVNDSPKADGHAAPATTNTKQKLQNIDYTNHTLSTENLTNITASLQEHLANQTLKEIAEAQFPEIIVPKRIDEYSQRNEDMFKVKIENERRSLGGADGEKRLVNHSYVTRGGVEIVASRSIQFDWPVLIIYAIIFVVIVGLSVFLCICLCDSSGEGGEGRENNGDEAGQSALERSYQ